MTKQSLATASAIALLTIASAASAQTAQWTEVCTDPAGPVAEYSTCMSAQLSYNSGTGAVDFWVWNMAGFDGSYTNSRIDAFGLAGVPWGEDDITSFAAQNAGALDRSAAWQVSSNGISGAGCCSLLFGLKQDGGNLKKDVVSSAHTAPSDNDVTTWGGDFNGGAGAFKFSWFVGTGLSFDPDGAILYAHHKEAAAGFSDQFYCFSDGALNVSCGGDGDDPGGPQETIPEPATMTLLATGLAGLAASRRRKNNR